MMRGRCSGCSGGVLIFQNRAVLLFSPFRENSTTIPLRSGVDCSRAQNTPRRWRRSASARVLLISSFTAFTLRSMTASLGTGLRLDAPLAARVDRVADEICRRASGMPCTRAAALRLLVARGLDVLERELGLPSPKTEQETP